MSSDRDELAAPEEIIFDFQGAEDIDLVIGNLSGIAVDGTTAWTVSDERRTFERLSASPSGFVLKTQYRLDDFFEELPPGHEADLESVDFADGRVWICGSHCRVRKEAKTNDDVNVGTRSRPSRNLLGSIRIGSDGHPIKTSAKAAPFRGGNSLRRKLKANAYLAPFVNLASKENGLDIEGLVVLAKYLLLGLRGPVIDSRAVVVALPRGASLPSANAKPHLHLLDLKGLGVRDLCRNGDAVIILAGPVTAANGPFRIFRWHPTVTDKVQRPELIHEWRKSDEHPEGVCAYQRQGRPGLLVVYDGPDPGRRSGTRVAEDWFPWSRHHAHNTTPRSERR